MSILSKIFLLLIFLLCCIIYGMAEFTWGDLPKNQTNAQTIEEAIAAAIAAHESDPDAHMGDGESIDIHRKNEIIDHPALSIVPDKFSGGDLIMNTDFRSLDGWVITGDVAVDDLNGVKLAVEYGAVNTSKMTGSKYVGGSFFDQSFDMYFETQNWFDFSNSHINAWMGWLNNYTNTTSGLGFQVRDGTLYAYSRHGGTTVDYSLGTIDRDNPHFYSVFFDASELTAYFYIDKVLVYTMDVASGTNWEDDTVPTYGVTLTQTNDGIIHAVYINSWRKLLTD